MRDETAPESGFYSVVRNCVLTLVVIGVRLSALPKSSYFRFLSVFLASRVPETFEADRRFCETRIPDA